MLPSSGEKTTVWYSGPWPGTQSHPPPVRPTKNRNDDFVPRPGAENSIDAPRSPGEPKTSLCVIVPGLPSTVMVVVCVRHLPATHTPVGQSLSDAQSLVG